MEDKALWTMVAEIHKNRTKYHVAPESFVSFCGRDNLLVRDYCEWRNGGLWRIGEGGGLIDSKATDEYYICKTCLKSLKKQQ